MKPDLQGLEITNGELRKLMGVAVEDITARFVPRVTLLSLWYGVVNYIAIEILRMVLYRYTPLTLPLTVQLSVSVGLGVATAMLHRWFWLRDNVSHSLRGLVADVRRFNQMIRAIDINDQIEAVGNPEVGIKDRATVLMALRLTREDLIRALKTERILRENQTFIARNPALFANNLAALTTLQVSDQATEHGRILNEALEIAVSAQQEMKQLRNEH